MEAIKLQPHHECSMHTSAPNASHRLTCKNFEFRLVGGAGSWEPKQQGVLRKGKKNTGTLEIRSLQKKMSAVSVEKSGQTRTRARRQNNEREFQSLEEAKEPHLTLPHLTSPHRLEIVVNCFVVPLQVFGVRGKEEKSPLCEPAMLTIAVYGSNKSLMPKSGHLPVRYAGAVSCHAAVDAEKMRGERCDMFRSAYAK